MQTGPMLHLLDEIPIFRGLTAGQLGQIAAQLEACSFPADAAVIREGTRDDAMYVIVDGSVKVSRRKGGEREIVLSMLSAGDYFGELALIDTLPRSADVTTLGPTDVLKLTRGRLNRLLEADPALAALFYRNCLAETFSRFRHILTDFTFARYSLDRKAAVLELISEDLSQARLVQHYFIDSDFLKATPEILPGVRQSYRYRPCLDVGGDFLNVLKLSQACAAIIIADIEGHGITASLATGVLKSALAVSAADMGHRPAQMLDFLNHHFERVIPNLFATCYYAVVDAERRCVTLAKAGHPHPLLWKRSADDFLAFDCEGVGLGMVTEARFGVCTLPVEPGDRLLFYTDGLIEQCDAQGRMYGRLRLAEQLRGLFREGAGDIPGRLVEDLETFAGKTALDDDVTLLLLEF